MGENIHHFDAIEKLYRLGFKKGYIAIKEFSVKNLGLSGEERFDLAWCSIDEEGKLEPRILFEFETTSKYNWGKFLLVPKALGIIFKVEGDLKETRLKPIFATKIKEGNELIEELKKDGIRIVE